MQQNFEDKCKELEEKIRILEEENDHLSERAEETLLLGLVAESIHDVEDGDILLENVLERFSILKSIPYCACFSINENSAQLISAYALFSDDPSIEVHITLSPSIIKEFNQGPYITKNLLNEAKGLSMNFQYENFSPHTVVIIPFETRSIPKGIFVFIDNDPAEDRLSPMIMVLQQVVDMAAARLDKISLLNELRKINIELDHRVEERTKELSRSNKRLQNEIIERKRSEQALRESEERLTAFMESAIDGFILFDSELNHIGMNKVALEITRLERKDVIGKNIIDTVPNIKETGRYDEYKKVMKTGVPFHIPDLISHPLADDKHIELKAFKVGDGLGIIFTDVTKRKQAEEALKESEARLKSYYQAAFEGIAISEQGKIIDFNRQIADIFGYERDELIGKEVMDLVAEEDRDFVLRNIRSGFD